MTLKDRLMELQDLKYADFQRKLMPTVPAEKVIGVRTPQLRNLAKELKGSEEAEAFLEELPHEFFDENQLHAFLIGEEKDFDKCIREVERFLPSSITGRRATSFHRRYSENTARSNSGTYADGWTVTTRTRCALRKAC